MNITNNRIRIALQKTGRLSEQSLQLLARCGIQIKPRKEQLFCHSDNFPLDLLLVRDDDIPDLVAEGMCDYGIIGTNVLEEKALEKRNPDSVQKIRFLNFASCRLAIALPKNITYDNLQSLANCRIATSYPYILANYFAKHNLQADIKTLTGSVEIAPRLGIAEAICDLVSTGATLEANNLREVETVFNSQAVLIKSPKTFSAEKKQTANMFQNRVEGSELANGSKYIMLHAPISALNTIVELLPGVERPSIMSLQGEPEKMAIHALCREHIFWETMENLKLAGASSILVLPVEKMLT